MSSPDIQMEVFGKTDVGLIREHNEDNLLVADLGGGLKESSLDHVAELPLGDHGALFLVCDGMGGAAAGEVASQMAVDAIFDVMAEGEEHAARDAFARQLRRAVETANERIFQQSRDNQNERGMGTTCTAAALIDDTLMVAQIGDSRCYVLRNQVLGQVTKDQSLAWQLIEAGALTQEDAKAFEHANIILQALGVQDRVEVVMSQVGLRRGDTLLLCSDGLHGPVSDTEIRDILVGEADLKKAGEALLQKALERDGPDNVTIVLARFTGQGLAEPAVDERAEFVGYDPGPDPIPERVGGDSGQSLLTTMEIRSPDGGRDSSWRSSSTSQAGGAELGAEAGTRARSGDPSRGKDLGNAGAARRGDRRQPGRRRFFDWREGVSADDARSVAALFLIGLLAVAAGGIVALKCDGTTTRAAHEVVR
jgi:serine/threonine protein phosphatase PrpC